jgi:hypothetical protein
MRMLSDAEHKDTDSLLERHTTDYQCSDKAKIERKKQRPFTLLAVLVGNILWTITVVGITFRVVYHSHLNQDLRKISTSCQ